MAAGERVSTVQVSLMLAASRLSLTWVFWGYVPGINHDHWWFSAIEALVGIGFAWILNHLWQRFPQQALTEVAEIVLGRVLGKLVVLLYVLFLLLMLALTLRLAGEVFIYAFLPRTPIIVIIAGVAFLAAWGAKAGIEVIGRSAQVIFPTLAGSILLIFLLLLKDIDFHVLLPPQILHSGPLPFLKDAIGVASRTTELILAGLMVPFINERRGVFRAVALNQVWQGVTWTFMAIPIYGILGTDIGTFYFPMYTIIRIVNIADFLERIDGLIVAIWLLGLFIRSTLFLWAAGIGSAHLLGLRQYRPLVIPLAGLAVSYAIAQAENITEIRHYLRPELLTPFSFTFTMLIPLLLLTVAALRGMCGTHASRAV